MRRRLERHPVEGTNPMRHWQRYICPWRSAWNFVVLYLARFVPYAGAKNSMYRMLGMKVGPDTAIGLMAMFDVFFPQLITIGNNTVIGYNCTVLAHEFLVDEWRTGRVNIGANVLIGANTTVLAGVTIGDGAIVGAGSVVAADVPPGAFVYGAPARPVERRT